MRLKLKQSLLAGLLATGTVLSATPVHAQLAAGLPDMNSVAPGEATDADGTYVVSTINKRITIENGRAYVVDPWTQALFFRVKPGMVTLQNFRQTGPDRFEADDLPMMGKVVFHRQPNGTLQGVVQGAMGEAKYALVPTDYASVGDGGSGIGDGPGVVDPTPSMHTYRLHVSRGNCSGKKLTRKKYDGTVKVSILDRASDRLISKHRNFRVECKDDGNRSQTYAFYNNGPGALTFTSAPDLANFSALRVEGKANGGIGGLIFNKSSQLLPKVRAKGRPLSVGEKVDDTVTVLSNKTELKFRVTLERVQ